MVLNEKQQNAVLFLAFVACISLLCNICLISKYREQKKIIQKQQEMLQFYDSLAELQDSTRTVF